MTTAIYPGSFDPLTNGHIDLIARAASLFDSVVVAIAQNINKTSFISLDERLVLTQDALSQFKGVEVKTFDNLLVDFAKEQNARILIRGLRAVSDFEYEFQLAGMNKKLNKDIETIFMTPAEQYSNLSSSLIREISLLGGDISDFVPKNINHYIQQNLIDAKPHKQ